MRSLGLRTIINNDRVGGMAPHSTLGARDRAGCGIRSRARRVRERRRRQRRRAHRGRRVDQRLRPDRRGDRRRSRRRDLDRVVREPGSALVRAERAGPARRPARRPRHRERRRLRRVHGRAPRGERIGGSGADRRRVLVDVAGRRRVRLRRASTTREHVDGFNEHVWYDVEAMGALAHGIQAKLEALSPSDADAFAANLDAFLAEIDGPRRAARRDRTGRTAAPTSS